MSTEHGATLEARGCLPAKQFFALAEQAVLGPGVHRYDETRLHVSGPTYGHIALLAIFARLLGAKRIVELGTGIGIGTRAFLDAVRTTGGHVWSVDMHPRVGREELKDNPDATFVIDSSTGFAKKWQGPVDLVYVDADHSAASVEADLTAWAKHNPRLFLVDDTLDTNVPHGSPLDGMEAFASKCGWTWWNLPLATGLGVLMPSGGA